jgi:hypothetical protein
MFSPVIKSAFFIIGLIVIVVGLMSPFAETISITLGFFSFSVTNARLTATFMIIGIGLVCVLPYVFDLSRVEPWPTIFHIQRF